MVKKILHKRTAFLTLFVFVASAASVLCCCMGEAEAVEQAANAHQHEDAGHAHQDHHHAKQGSSHDHSECNHSQLLGPYVSSRGMQFFKLPSEIFKLQEKSLPSLELFSSPTLVSESPPLETGPPVKGLSSTPLYLQISVLRI